MKALVIVKKEYKQIVKKKSFIISTILMPLIMAAFIFLPMLLSKYGRGEKTIQIADFSGFIGEQLVEELKGDVKKGLTFINIQVAGTEPDTLIEEMRKKILDKKTDGLLFIPEQVKESRNISFYALNISDFESNKYITSIIQKLISKQILKEKNIDPKVVEEATKSITLKTQKVTDTGVKELSSGTEYMMSIFMLTILFSVLMGYGQLIMRGIIEEKNNRIIEVLISSTNAQNLFYGKIIGIGLAGLTQVAIWIAIGALFMGRASGGMAKELTSFLTPELGIYFVVFFTIGYFMYSILFSIVGASVNTDQEAQQYSAPITYILIIPFIMGFMVTQNPNTPAVLIASLFPLFTPTLMFMRISIAAPPLLQIMISILSSVLFTLFLAWLGAKIFRIGILMYGKKPSLSEIFRWIRYK